MRMDCISDKEILLELRLKTILLSDVFEGRTDKYGSIKLQNLKITVQKYLDILPQPHLMLWYDIYAFSASTDTLKKA